MDLNNTTRAGVGQSIGKTSTWRKFGLTQAKKSGGVIFWNTCRKNIAIQNALESRFSNLSSDFKPLHVIKPLRPEAVKEPIFDDCISTETGRNITTGNIKKIDQTRTIPKSP